MAGPYGANDRPVGSVGGAPQPQPQAPRSQQRVLTGPDPYKRVKNEREERTESREEKKFDIEAEKFEMTKEEIAEKKAKEASNIQTATMDLTRVIKRLDRVAEDANDNSGWLETGTLGSWARNYGPSGSPAASLKRDLDLVGSNAAIEALMQMRRDSPTGAGVGNVALGEMQLMKDKYGIFDPDQPHGDFMRNMAEGKEEFLRLLTRINPKAAAQLRSTDSNGIWLNEQGKWYVGKRRKSAATPSTGKLSDDELVEKYLK